MLDQLKETIIALSTAPGVGAIAVIRLSGEDAITITNSVFKGKNLLQQKSHTAHFGTIRNDEGEIIDEVVATLFIAPHSFTKENVVEISCHGSPYIVQRLIKLFLTKGVRLAKAGEFTQRAFLNGQFDLAQAEAVADLINADTEASHKAALNQMRGGFSEQIKQLRAELIHFASMIELELDFGEEDVEFADRDDLKKLVNQLLSVITALVSSFDLGNVIKNGVPTVIAGKPNTGKSTLLNALLNEEKAIVSDIAGTTRDFIEDEINLEGVVFRFIDTAGLRDTEDKVEAIGVQRTKDKMKQASLIVYMFDLKNDTLTEVNRDINMLENLGIPFIKVGNKLDEAQQDLYNEMKKDKNTLFISAINKEGLEALKTKLVETVNLDNFKTGDTVVTNIRHYDNLVQTQNSLNAVLRGLDDNITGDFLALDIRHALRFLGEITGEITTDDLLANIFSKFCIGK
ncbi:tRNA modification GTPase MnmE [Marivirga tractuosa]|uniref:tRNA modification GTPase MnmE n=1 Tax=Marivirga tractuosa (strain ATCC 23168 / DSM 4126 / NBRC 15989 / NCIMB 1408 / VKM B-1430 / H-43) TaxID=643867 RepID=E4TNQ2_MARTH|nr:tRNA uridine-5-carboxymethylaminomethyl(34) synthesis GTPase MnmE [Marivirga tractuosa]ADR21489.1 tRNA modification GTPase trmE [Marivirga tractuosa DSM 4126]BDD14057.1 tRNA modification GTPase MnmE [Marivirga tractuosa]